MHFRNGSNEDQARNRMDNGPYNLAILRYMAMNIMQRDTFNPSYSSCSGVTYT